MQLYEGPSLPLDTTINGWGHHLRHQHDKSTSCQPSLGWVPHSTFQACDAHDLIWGRGGSPKLGLPFCIPTIRTIAFLGSTLGSPTYGNYRLARQVDHANSSHLAKLNLEFCILLPVVWYFLSEVPFFRQQLSIGTQTLLLILLLLFQLMLISSSTRQYALCVNPLP